VEVDACGLGLLVAEPEGDDGHFDAGVQESHGGGVAQDVRADLLAGQGRALCGCRGGVKGQAALDGVAAEAAARACGEQDLRRAVGEFFEPFAQDGHGGGGERGDALLAALAVAGDVRAGAEVDAAGGEGGELGDAQAG
jgi:hypothetical protein